MHNYPKPGHLKNHSFLLFNTAWIFLPIPLSPFPLTCDTHVVSLQRNVSQCIQIWILKIFNTEKKLHKQYIFDSNYNESEYASLFPFSVHSTWELSHYIMVSNEYNDMVNWVLSVCVSIVPWGTTFNNTIWYGAECQKITRPMSQKLRFSSLSSN